METAVVDGRDLAAHLKTHPASIRAHRAGLRSPAVLRGLPEPIQTQPKLLWLRADIDAWLESRRTFRAELTTAPSPAPLAPRRRGRPPKAEQARRARLNAELDRAADDIRQLKAARKVAEERGEQ